MRTSQLQCNAALDRLVDWLIDSAQHCSIIIAAEIINSIYYIFKIRGCPTVKGIDY